MGSQLGACCNNSGEREGGLNQGDHIRGPGR